MSHDHDDHDEKLPPDLQQLMAMAKALGIDMKAIGMGKSRSEKWIQVAVLKPEDKLKWQKFQLDDGKRKEKCRQLMVQANLLKAQHEKAKSDIWKSLYESYNLPPDESYKVRDNQFIERDIASDGQGD